MYNNKQVTDSLDSRKEIRKQKNIHNNSTKKVKHSYVHHSLDDLIILFLSFVELSILYH